MSEPSVHVTVASFPWCESTPPLPLMVVFYWGTHFFLLFNIIITIIGIYQMFNKKVKKTDNTSNLFKVLWILVSFLFTLAPPGFAFGFQAGWECWYGFFGWEAITMTGVDAYCYGLSVLNLFFIMRLKTVFADTALKLKSITLVVLYFCVSVQFITPIISTYFFLSGWHQHERMWGLRFFSIFQYTNIVSSTLVLVLFVRKILLLPTMKDNNCESATNINAKKQQRKMKFLNLIMKYMVCAVFSSLSTFIVACFGIARSEGLNRDIVYRGLHILFMTMDSSINLLCLYLQFPIGLSLYNKLCIATHACFYYGFVRLFHLNVHNHDDTNSVITVSSEDHPTHVNGAGATVV